LGSVASFEYGMLLENLGELDEARKTLEQAVDFSIVSGNLHVLPMALSHLAQIHLSKGDLRKAQKTYQQALERASEITGKPSPMVCHAYSGLGILDYEWNDLEAAQANFDRCLALAKPFNNWETLLPTYLTMVKIQCLRQRKEEALQLLSEAEQIWQKAHRTEGLSLFQAWRAFITGDRSSLAEVVEKGEGGDQPDHMLLAYLAEAALQVRSHIYVRLGELAEADAMLNRVFLPAETGKRWRMVIEVLVLRSIVCESAGVQAEALSCMRRALELAEEQGYVRTFLDEGEPAARLIRKLAEGNDLSSSTTRYARSLLQAFEGKPGSSPAPNTVSQPSGREDLIEPLTEREMEIIRLMAQGLSNSEIASRLVITPGTVKVHANNIYSKLGVNNRTAAVVRARALGLLDG
jgi:LuxR family transcriptional regulator, maltose regulon positive regulatory protein